MDDDHNVILFAARNVFRIKFYVESNDRCESRLVKMKTIERKENTMIRKKAKKQKHGEHEVVWEIFLQTFYTFVVR